MSRALNGPTPGRRSLPMTGAAQPYDALALGVAQRLDLLSARPGVAGLHRSRGAPGRVLLVTSARPGEGKSFIVGKLARRLAWVLGEPIAVVDANGDRPVAGAVFKVGTGESPGLGLFACVAKGRLLPDQFQPCGMRDVFVMATRGEGRGSLLTRLAPLARVLDDCRRRYALTIVDAGCLAETGGLTQLADGSLLVVDASRTRRDAIQGALAMPQIERSRFLGVALNRQPRDIPDWLYRRLM